MQRPSAWEFVQALLETLEDLPPELARRVKEVLEGHGAADRAQALRKLFEEFAGE
jgi:hypothetical protein